MEHKVMNELVTVWVHLQVHVYDIYEDWVMLIASTSLLHILYIRVYYEVIQEYKTMYMYSHGNSGLATDER